MLQFLKVWTCGKARIIHLVSAAFIYKWDCILRDWKKWKKCCDENEK